MTPPPARQPEPGPRDGGPRGARDETTIGFDLDDVLLSFYPVFADVLLREHGIDARQAERTAWEYVEIAQVQAAGLDQNDVRRVVQQACVDADAHEGRPLIHEALRHAVRRLRRDGHRVVLTTARPPTAAVVVAQWLESVDVVFEELRFGPRSKLGLDVLVEDNAVHVLRAAEAGTVVFVPDRPWNRAPALDAHPCVVRYWDPEELEPLLRSRLAGQDDPYGFTTADGMRRPVRQASAV